MSGNNEQDRIDNTGGKVQSGIISRMLEGSESADIHPSHTEVLAGFGWTVMAKKKKGLFGLRSVKEQVAADCDGAVFLCRADGSVVSEKLDECCVYYSNTSLYDRCVVHNGDNLTGEGDGDDETILLRLSRLPAKVCRIILVMNLFKNADKEFTFADLEEAFVRLTDAKTGDELVRVDLPVWAIDAGVVVGGILDRTARGWCFRTCHEQMLRADTLEDLAAALRI